VKYLVSAFFILMVFGGAKAQVVINEASNRNYTQVYDDVGDTHDWFELYNPESADTSLEGWGISDNKEMIGKWIFPDYTLKAGEYLLAFASGLDIKDAILVDHWESAILPSDLFNYQEPTAATPSNWNTLAFDAASWSEGTAGFGYGDGDDNTITSSSIAAVYIRRYFDIPDTSVIASAVLHVDYDDGFVAYLNGVEIARSGISGAPSWNSLASANHEALMWQGKDPEKFELDMSLIRDCWIQGNNLFAIEVHNTSLTSSDLSLIPFLSFGIRTTGSFFQPVPDWFPNHSEKFMHTNFKIDPDGETLYLSSPSSVVLDSLAIPRIPLNASFGRITDDSSATGIFLDATPGESNNTSQAYTSGYEPVPQFSEEAGFYPSAVSVMISSPSPTAVIRYTTDGSEPTASSSLYQGSPITISSTKTVKAKCFSTTDKLPGATNAATYFINVSHVLPVISISTDNENLYGSTGIFDNIDENWNKPCYIEYFDAEKALIFKQEAGIQIDGGAGGSRSQPQHSVRIEPGNGTLGEGDVKYELIPDRPNRNSYSSFYLRNGSNQYNTLQYKDGLQVKAIAKNTHTYYSAYSAIVAYINGSYFGLYELREKLNADFLAENYLMNIDSLDLLSLSYYKGSVLEALEGTVDGFWDDYNHLSDFSPDDADYLNQVGAFLDLRNYTDYIIAQAWIGNTDWPFNNIMVFRNSSTGFRWQFAVQDVEWAMQPNGWTSSTTDQIGYMLGQGYGYPYIGYWLNLMQNDEYRTFFINRFADLMNTNYLFSNIGSMEEEIYSYQYPEMPAEFDRWGNSTMAAYISNHNTLRSQLEIRSGYVRQHMQSHFNLARQVEVTLDVQPAGAGQIKISTIVPVDYPWQGIYFSDNPVKLTALANPGYKFSNWSDNSLIGDPESPAFIVDFSGSTASFTVNFEATKENFKGVTISEIHYKNGLNENSTDWVELYNGADSPVNLGGWYFTDNDPQHIFQFGSTALIGENSRLVIAQNTNDFRAKYPEVTNYTGPFDFKLGTPLDAVRLYDNTDSLIAEVNYSDIFPWPLNGDESGRTLELRNPAGDLNDPSNWFAGCIGGSPGSSFSPCNKVVDELEEPVLTLSSLSAYPNPAADYVNIAFSLQKGYNNCTLKLYDMMGAEVDAMDIGYLEEGTSTLSMDLSGAPAGLLIIVFQAEGIMENIKILHVE
jgi:hypothetical protein